MARPGNAVVTESWSIAIRHSLYIAVIRLDCTILVGAFGIEVSRLIGTSMCLLFKTRHNNW